MTGEIFKTMQVTAPPWHHRLAPFYKFPDLADVIIQCHNHVNIAAHQSVLGPKSAFLKSFFDAARCCVCSGKDCITADTVTLSLPDVRPEAVRRLLQLLYTGITVLDLKMLDELKEVVALMKLEIPPGVLKTVKIAKVLDMDCPELKKRKVEKTFQCDTCGIHRSDLVNLTKHKEKCPKKLKNPLAPVPTPASSIVPTPSSNIIPTPASNIVATPASSIVNSFKPVTNSSLPSDTTQAYFRSGGSGAPKRILAMATIPTSPTVISPESTLPKVISPVINQAKGPDVPMETAEADPLSIVAGGDEIILMDDVVDKSGDVECKEELISPPSSPVPDLPLEIDMNVVDAKLQDDLNECLSSETVKPVPVRGSYCPTCNKYVPDKKRIREHLADSHLNELLKVYVDVETNTCTLCNSYKASARYVARHAGLTHSKIQEFADDGQKRWLMENNLWKNL